MNYSLQRTLIAEISTIPPSPIFIWGSGEIASLTEEALKNIGIKINGFVIDYGTPIDTCVYQKSDVIKRYKDFILIRGFLQSFFMSDDEIIAQWPGCKKVYTVPDIYEPSIVEPLNEDFYQNSKKNFDRVKTSLADDFSKESLTAYLEAKITGRNEMLIPNVIKTQYFFEPSPWNYSSTDILIDGGAYTGDSLMDFVKLRKNNYQKIIACEPDKSNFEKLKKTVREKYIENVNALNIGLLNKRTILKFSSSGTMESFLSDAGNIEIQVDAIDNFTSDELISIIKMDIEGAEIEALKGAEKTIKNCRPILMISAYHKKDDLFNIFDYINAIVKDYSFFFRCHKPLAIDAVLYAVPYERLK